MQSLKKLQKKVKKAEIRKGHISDDAVYKCFILMEELGEMAKALRIFLKKRTHSSTEKYELEDELADVLYLIIAIANRADIDLAEALINKIEKDEAKVYSPAK